LTEAEDRCQEEDRMTWFTENGTKGSKGVTMKRRERIIMRTRVGMLATAGVLLLSLAGFAQPAAATPATPYRVAGCNPATGGVEYCYESQGVTKYNETPSGDTQMHIVGESCYTYTGTVTGEVLANGCRKDNFIFNETRGETQPGHHNETREFAYTHGGVRYECTEYINATYANGEYRHEVRLHECSPPL
jgi:hypothetical protein